MKKCKNCSHWERFDSSYGDYGECKESSPRLDPLLLLFRSDFYKSMSPVVQNQSTLWPTPHKNQQCDRWTD